MSDVAAWVGVGLVGAAGAYARFAVGGAVTARRPSDFPFGTFVVNVTGGFALGLLVGLAVHGDARLVLGTGFLGAYTTFSTWMVEAQRLGEDGEWATMCWYLLGSMAAGLAATGAGWLLGEALG
ncbi:MAG TPA: fluoride efflux transporter CrcB [Solirubrobacteraceae bacterium]|nr:fluoride efflux transporter CrcB [Solirubrobacteraceae bacterium]